MKITKKQAQESLQTLLLNYEFDEKRHYSEWYNIEEPHKIPTNKLLEHHYKDLRILTEYFGLKKYSGKVIF